MRWLIILIMSSCLSLSVSAQDCTQNLEEARRAYFNGSFERVIQLLSGECIGNRLQGTEKTDALRLMIQSNLLIDQDSLADQLTFKLFQHDPLYTSRSTDLLEFQTVQKNYYIKTRFNLGLIAGVNFPQFEILEYRSYASVTNETKGYEPIAGFLAGAVIETPIYKSIYASSGLIYQSFGYQQREDILNYQQVTIKEKLHYLMIPFQLKWKVNKWSINPFISGGINIHRLIKSTADLSLLALPTEFPTAFIGVPEIVSGYDISTQRKEWTLNCSFGVGVSKSLGMTHLEIGVFYDYGLNNLVEVDNRYSDENLYKTYSYVADDFKMDNLRFSIGVSRSFVKPKKLTK